MKNSADLAGCYPPRPSASVDNSLLDLQNSPYHTQPHSMIAKYILHNASFHTNKFPTHRRKSQDTLFANLRKKYNRDKKKTEVKMYQALVPMKLHKPRLVSYSRVINVELIALAYFTFLPHMQQV